jgi:hypothetical protein
MKHDKVTLAELVRLLARFGFESTRLRDRLLFEHEASDTLLVLRRYRANEAIGEADLISVRHMLDQRGFVERNAFEEAVRAVKDVT